MSLHVATTGAIAFSGMTVCLCLLAISAIYRDVQDIWSELDNEMDMFKMQADDLWNGMLQLGAGTKANRERRNSYGGYGASGSAQVNPAPHTVSITAESSCQCKLENSCPPGQRGSQGDNGPEGEPGLPGHPGKDGLPAPDIHNGGLIGCFSCPVGPQGLPGDIGRPGIRGMRGAKGQAGAPGRDGFPGSPGEMGNQGQAGADGSRGTPGEKGSDAEQGFNRKGHRGLPGEQGPEGPEGDHGAPGPVGAPGPAGIQGTKGSSGAAGSDGEEGCIGPSGKVGDDAAYCPCPPRSGARHGTSAGVQSSGNHGARPYKEAKKTLV